MQPGPARGESATLEIAITEDMAARVGGEIIHPVYGTTAMIGHVEEVCRTLLVPHLEEGEEGVGQRVELYHRAPAPIGANVTVTATVATSNRSQVTCEVVVRNGSVMVARGSFEQRVLPTSEWKTAIATSR